MRRGDRLTTSRHYGYCHACGEHYMPDKATLEEIMSSLQDQYGMQFDEDYLAEPLTIDPSLLPQHADSFSAFAANLFGDISKSHLAPLISGDSHGNTIWLYTDVAGQVTGAKTMPYDPETGKRRKPGISINLTGGPVDFPAIHGYFTGSEAHDLADPRLWSWLTKAKGYRPGIWGLATIPAGSPLYLVESEKSAVLASLQWPDRYFAATGGASSLTAQKLRDLLGHKVTIVMDNDDAGVKGAQRIGRMCEIYEVDHNYIDVAALAKSHKIRVTEGLDIGDIAVILAQRENVHA